MEAILGGMIEGVLVVNDHGRVQLVNGAARAHAAAPGRSGRPALPRDRPPARHRRAARRRRSRGTPTEGLELTLPREPELVIISRSAPVASPGAAGAVLVLHDITDLRRADRIRRDFVANVSHELRTPLTAVRGYVEALLDQGERGRRTGAGPPLPRNHRPAHAAHGAPGARSAAPRAARRRPGTARAGPLPRRVALRRRRNRARVGARGAPAGRRAPDRRRRRDRRRAIPPSCTTRCATCSRTRPTTRPNRAAS